MTRKEQSKVFWAQQLLFYFLIIVSLGKTKSKLYIQMGLNLSDDLPQTWLRQSF